MISFLAYSLIFSSHKLYFLEQREEDMENCSPVTVHQIFIYFQGYNSQKSYSVIIEITLSEKNRHDFIS